MNKWAPETLRIHDILEVYFLLTHLAFKSQRNYCILEEQPMYKVAGRGVSEEGERKGHR